MEGEERGRGREGERERGREGEKKEHLEVIVLGNCLSAVQQKRATPPHFENDIISESVGIRIA
jgi:hypothetical protein